jgi:hypothetical protein
VKELADRFATGITRSAPGCRLQVTMSPDLFKRAIRYTVRQTNNQKPPPMLPINEDMLMQRVEGMMHDTSDSFDSYPVLYLPTDYDKEVEPVVLQSGQHRVAALLHLFSRDSDYSGYTKTLFTPATISVSRQCAINNC